VTFENDNPFHLAGKNGHLKKPVNGSREGCRTGRGSSSITIGSTPAHVVVAPDPADYARVTALTKAYDEGEIDIDSVRDELNCQSPWDIFRFSARYGPSRFDVWMFDHAAFWPCPLCTRELPRIANTDPHVFKCRTCRCETYVYVKIPVVHCPDHGRQEAIVPWRERPEKWTYERTVIPEDEPECR
jgi:hypothetical protein